MIRAVLLDLDDTLVVEEAAAVATFRATADVAAAHHPIDPDALARAARSRAREAWRAAPTHPYCARVGISSWEGMWCRFEGGAGDLPALRRWAPAYRREAWRRALADHGIEDDLLAEELADRFSAERRARHETFADAAPALDALAGHYALALVTNGASCLQREKLAASGLADRFDAVIVGGDVGVGKPDRRIFERALEAVSARPDEAVMVGNNLSKDVEGAVAAGVRAIWVNREGAPAPPRVLAVGDLQELPALLSR
ncbi:MAG: phosphoserine phosphatase [Solirubrobacteraceae bacterium]